MKEYNIKELNSKLHELLSFSEQQTQEMLEHELVNINEETLCEMSDLTQEDTNLPCIVWIDGPRNMKHGFRIKFQNSYSNKDDGSEMIPISISDNPQIPKSINTKLRIKQKDINKIKKWIILNKDILLQFAKGEISTRIAIQNIRKLED